MEVVWDMIPFDVQLIGAVVLHEGKIAEMATGEGKTLVATMPLYLNALAGKGVHLVTVNDYLARRDAEWMGPIYRALGLTVGCIQHMMDDKERQEAYGADVTYGTNNEFGFDYLRDNMKFDPADFVQRELHYAIVDEVDSILIDEARTPLIISGPAEESTDKYYRIDRLIPRLRAGTHYQLDEKTRTVALTENGVAHAEKLLGVENLYDLRNIETLHHVNQALKAHTLFKRDRDYVVKGGKVIIVDEFTGRLMEGRRYSDGLHQALEAKEKVKIESENQTLATITFQNYFRMYEKLAGMTGTADTEAAEFAEIYNLDVVVIPTNVPLVRYNYPDVIYRTEREKFDAVLEEIKELHRQGRPVLVGTISIEKSELLSKKLERHGIPHQVLNAKHHEREAAIVAQAGRKGAVTISTNMAGRGTDILLGGNPEFRAKAAVGGNLDDPEYEKKLEEFRRECAAEHDEVVKLGGLHILGTERHESRRIDNQLRGRAGRQGDPGSSRFYLSLEDDLLRIFGSDRISGIMQKLGMEEGVPIEHNMVTRAVESAQRKVEAHNFEIRKHLLEYDDVMNKQREVIYAQRREVLQGEGIRETVLDMLDEVLEGILLTYTDPQVHFDDWDLKGLKEALDRQFGLKVKLDGLTLTPLPGGEPLDLAALTTEELRDALFEVLKGAYEAKAAELGEELMDRLERMVMLQVIDSQWKDHLLAMDHLKEGIGFRGYAQKNPLNEYKREGFEMFQEMTRRIKENFLEYLFKLQPAEEFAWEARERPLGYTEHRGEFQGISEGGGGDGRGEAPRPVTTVRREGKKIGRNEPCPCGSGKKYKKCCGAAGVS
ncbi:MAG: preprotein translocase subunit SecA [Nitrospinota bacterium]